MYCVRAARIETVVEWFVARDGELASGVHNCATVPTLVPRVNNERRVKPYSAVQVPMLIAVMVPWHQVPSLVARDPAATWAPWKTR